MLWSMRLISVWQDPKSRASADKTHHHLVLRGAIMLHFNMRNRAGHTVADFEGTTYISTRSNLPLGSAIHKETSCVSSLSL